jgi:hypothetical protein
MGRRGFKTHGKVVWPGYSEIEPRRIAKIGRNDPCPCESGKKYKDCHEKDGEVFLAKLAQEEDKKRLRQLRKEMKERGVPWYKRIFYRR